MKIQNPIIKDICIGIGALVALITAGCASLQDVQKALGSPSQVQAELTILGAVAKTHIPSTAYPKIHTWALQINSAADLNLEPLFALIPQTGSQNADALIAAAKAYLTAIVNKYGARNQTSIEYAHAVGNALLANF